MLKQNSFQNILLDESFLMFVIDHNITKIAFEFFGVSAFEGSVFDFLTLKFCNSLSSAWTCDGNVQRKNCTASN